MNNKPIDEKIAQLATENKGLGDPRKTREFEVLKNHAARRVQIDGKKPEEVSRLHPRDVEAVIDADHRHVNAQVTSIKRGDSIQIGLEVFEVMHTTGKYATLKGDTGDLMPDDRITIHGRAFTVLGVTFERMTVKPVRGNIVQT